MFKALTPIALFAIIVFAAAPLTAAVPQLISHQGLITDSSGDPVADSTYTVTFTIYDAPTGGTNLWSSGPQPIATSNGLYGYLLGGNVPFPGDLFSAGADRWLGIQVDGDAEIVPRTNLTSAPYAIQAGNADIAQAVVANAIGTTEIADSTITAQDVSQEAWTAPTLMNGWVNYGGVYNPAGYFKDVNGIVHLRGLLHFGTVASPVFVLPPGYRPAYRELQVNKTSSGFGRVDIWSTGEVVFQEGSGTTWQTLDGITFRAGN